MVSTESLLIGGASVVAAFILTRGSESTLGTSTSASDRQPTGPTQGNVLDTISAFNEGQRGVNEQNVLDTISAFNKMEQATNRSGESQKTLPPDFRRFNPQTKEQIRKLPQEQIDMLPTSDDPPLSATDLDVMLGEGTIVGDPDVLPDSNPVQVVRNAFRQRAGLEL